MLVGTDEFYDLVVNSDVFVDKSLMVKELLEDSGKVILITSLNIGTTVPRNKI